MSDEPQYSRRAESVRCIRCDSETHECKALYFERGASVLYLCPGCFESVKDRDRLRGESP